MTSISFYQNHDGNLRARRASSNKTVNNLASPTPREEKSLYKRVAKMANGAAYTFIKCIAIAFSVAMTLQQAQAQTIPANLQAGLYQGAPGSLTSSSTRIGTVGQNDVATAVTHVNANPGAYTPLR